MQEENIGKLTSIKMPIQYTNWIFLNNKKQLFELKPALTPEGYVELCSKFKELYNSFDDFVKNLDSEQPDYESKMRCCFAGIVIPYSIWNKISFKDMRSILDLGESRKLNVLIVK